MPNDSDSASGERFARDMRRIRESRGVSIDEIHEATRIALNLIEAFEEGGLYDHPAFNRVYLRSFVRAYAGTIDVDPDDALRGLEAATEGTYAGALADAYLHGDAPPSEEAAAEDASAEFDTPDPDAPESDASDSDAATAFAERARADHDETEEAEADELQHDEKGADEDADAADADAADADAEEAIDEETVEEEPSGEASGVRTADDQTADPGGTDPQEADLEEADLEGETPGTDASDDVEADDADTDLPRTPSRDPIEGAISDPVPIPGTESDEEEREEATDDVGEGTPSWWSDDAGAPKTQVESPTGASGTSSSSGTASSDAATPDASFSEPSLGTSRPDPAQLSGGGPSSFFEERKRELVIGAVVLVLILVVGIGLGTGLFSSDDPAPEPQPVADTTAVDTTVVEEADPRPPLANITLGPTLELTVVAEEDVLGIRIQRDGDLRRPYWIDAGEATVFPFETRATVQEELDNVQLLLEGYPYPTDRRDAQGRVVITRDSAEAFADTLRGDPVSLDVEPDTSLIPAQ